MRTPLAIITLGLAALLAGCQALPVKVLAKAMDNAQTEENVKYLQQYADEHIHQDITVQADLAYGELPSQRLDVVYPAQRAQAKLPVVFLVHGGGWVAGHKEAMLPYARLIADRGFAVVNVEYTLVPKAAYPQQVQELNQAVRYVLHNAARWPIDTQRVYLSGDSAGANIVTSYAAALNSPEMAAQLQLAAALAPPQLKGLVLHSGVYDIKALYHGADKAGAIMSWGTHSVLAQYSGERQPSDATLDRMSAYPWLNARFPPVYISASEADTLTKTQTLPLIERLKQLNVPVTAQIYPLSYREAINHDFNFNMRFDASREVFDQSMKFLAQHAR